MKIQSGMSPSSSNGGSRSHRLRSGHHRHECDGSDDRQCARNCLCIRPSRDRHGVWRRSDLRLPHQPCRDARYDHRRPPPVRELPGYIIAQLLGAIAGAAVPVVILSSKLTGYDLAASGLGQNGWGEGYLSGYGLLGALVTEFVATFIFVYVILAATNPTVNLQVAGLIIGLTLFALHFPFINVTGLSVNPARSLGPAVLVGGKALAQVWLFLVVPSLAGACAGLLFREDAARTRA